ncbi:hypothetical protein ACSSS7_005932 [Eimeria intestinalis]
MLLRANITLAAAAALLLFSLGTMAKASPPSHEELQKQLDSAAQVMSKKLLLLLLMLLLLLLLLLPDAAAVVAAACTLSLLLAGGRHTAVAEGRRETHACIQFLEVVDFSHVSGSESPDSAEIRVPVHARVVVRLSCAGGYRGVLAAAHSGLAAADDASSALQHMSSEDAVKLVENPPPMPDGLTAHQAIPYHSSSGVGGMVGGPVPFLSIVETHKPGDYTLVYTIMRIWAPQSAARYILKLHQQQKLLLLLLRVSVLQQQQLSCSSSCCRRVWFGLTPVKWVGDRSYALESKLSCCSNVAAAAAAVAAASAGRDTLQEQQTAAAPAPAKAVAAVQQYTEGLQARNP